MKQILLMFTVVTLLLAACGTNPLEKEGKTSDMETKDGQHGLNHGSKNESGHNEHEARNRLDSQSSHNEQASAGHEHTAEDAVKADTAKADWTFLGGEKPQAKEETTLQIQILNKTGQPIENFDINHEKKLHLIVVARIYPTFTIFIRNIKGKVCLKSRQNFRPAGNSN
jgi:hypothetical protein